MQDNRAGIEELVLEYNMARISLAEEANIVVSINEMHNGGIKIENITDRSGVRVTLTFK